MRIALISEHYPPMRTSAAVQMRDLAIEFSLQGHEPIVITPSTELESAWKSEVIDGVEILRQAVSKGSATNYLKRTIYELVLPFKIIRNLRKSSYRVTPLGLVVWYSPTIFFGPLIWYLKRTSGCKSYLILRDIFPEWAYDLGLIRTKLTYVFFKLIANFQYSMADTIGVQTTSNLSYLSVWASRPNRHLEVLQNWQTPCKNIGSSINLKNTSLAGRKIFAYIGNMGIAQGMDVFIDLADSLKNNSELGFLFVGRGSEVNRLKDRIKELSLSNILFFNEIDPLEIPGLLKQCHVGLLALDLRHKTHNIPGKFLTYLHSSIPILARVNPNTDLARLIEEEGVGKVYVGESVEELKILAEEFIIFQESYEKMASRGLQLAKRMFSSKNAVQQIINATKKTRV